MKQLNKYLLVIYLLLPLCFLHSCKSPKLASTGTLTKMSVEQRIHSVVESAVDYKTFTSNITLSLTNNHNKRSQAIDGQLKMVKDEAIQLSLKMPILGSELFRMTISHDRIIVVDRMNKQYFTSSIEELKSKSSFDFNYYNLQALFSNHLFISGKQGIETSDYPSFEVREDDYFAFLDYKDAQDISYLFTADNSNRIQKTVMTMPESDLNLEWEYSEFKATSGNKYFPTKSLLKVQLPDKEIKVNINYKSIELDKNFNIDYNIPQKYNQINTEQLIQIIRSLS